MKKGLLLAIGVTAGLGLAAQAPKVSGVKKADLTNSKTTILDADNVNFYASSNSVHRNTNANSIQSQGVKFSSSYNAFGLLVSQSHVLTANQALNVAMMTHRISQDWSADANVASGYLEYSWTSDCGNSWDSSYVADQTSLGNKRFRYPSGAIINPAGNTLISGAFNVASGPYTDGTNWLGYYYNNQQMINGATQNTSIITNYATQGQVNLGMARVDMTSYDDSCAWVSAGRYADPVALTGYNGAIMMKIQKNGASFVTSFDSIVPSFHQDGTGTNDTWTQAHLSFSKDGSVGYCVFFGVDAAATTPSTRTYSPMVWKSVDHGVTWNAQPINDFTTIPVISDFLIPATGGSLKPWFDQSQGSDIVVDNNNQLHIVCTISSGSSDDDDSLGYTWTLTGQSGATARHYIYDVHTTPSGWDAWMIDSLMTTTSTTQTIFVDGSNAGAAYATDARLQVSVDATHTKLFYLWADTDPNDAQGENALPDLYGRGYDLTAGMYTNKKPFTTTKDFYFHYVSTLTLLASGTYTIPVTNSFDRNGSHDVATTFDHFYFCGATFTQSEFTNNFVGVPEIAAFGSFTTFPNPANDAVNVKLNLNHSGAVNFTIVNTVGQVVITENRMLNEGSNSVQLNTSALSAGVYFVTVSSDNGKATSKIVIE